MIEKSRWRFSCSLCFSLDWCSFHLPFIIIPNLSFLVPFLIGSRDSFVAPKAVIIIIKASGGGDGKCKMEEVLLLKMKSFLVSIGHCIKLRILMQLSYQVNMGVAAVFFQRQYYKKSKIKPFPIIFVYIKLKFTP